MKQIMSRYFFLWVGLLVVFIPSISEAASLYIDPAFNHLYRGDSVILSVRIDVDEKENECVNAVDAVLTYTDNIEPIDFSIGDSIMNVWVEQPVIDKENKQITFAGGIPNGYCGRIIGDPMLTNVVAQIVFKSPGFTIGGTSDGNLAVVDFADSTTVYLNDGRGTKAGLSTYPAQITLDEKVGDLSSNEWKNEIELDNIKPEEFSIDEILQFPNGKYYVTFSTTDKQTGIDHYEAIEEPLSDFWLFKWGATDAPWVVVQQPPVYVLEDQTLNSIIRIKAVDKAGNEYIATIIPDESQRMMPLTQISLIFVIVLIVIFVIVIIWFVVRRVIVKRKKKEEKEDNIELEKDQQEEVKEDYENNEEKHEY